jgi:hypothetical protein
LILIGQAVFHLDFQIKIEYHRPSKNFMAAGGGLRSRSSMYPILIPHSTSYSGHPIASHPIASNNGCVNKKVCLERLEKLGTQ